MVQFYQPYKEQIFSIYRKWSRDQNRNFTALYETSETFLQNPKKYTTTMEKSEPISIRNLVPHYFLNIKRVILTMH